nr:putative ribonuclease H-like domain-containing protein [Tanacetum cinerariifolium]
MRPFGCPVTILNTLDPLGKFKGKVDERFLVGYSNNDEDAAFDGKEHNFHVKKPKSEVILTLSSRYRDLNAEFEDCYDNRSNKVNAAGSIVPTVGQNSLTSTNTFSAAVVGAEADFNNLETSITVSPIPTTRIHKDHPVSQIIGDLSSTTQTRSMTRVVKEQGRLSQMFNDDFHTFMFACFLSQEEPKRVHQALKDPSLIEAMQEELLQFKMLKVWVLVDLPHGKRAIDDYCRFPWVFFLATKNETSPILKTFITGLENQLSLKVKVIRSDNRTEFKNNELNQFCGIMGIKREFSVPRTLSKNGIAERKHKTLIKAVRTMLADSLLPIPF